MPQVTVTGKQVNIQNIANDISLDPTAIGSIASGVLNDSGATSSFDGNYLRIDGTNTMTGNLVMGSNNIVITGTVSGRNIATDGTTQDTHIGDITIHRSINDGGNGASDLFSASKIIADLTLKANTNHVHDFSSLTDFIVNTPSSGEILSFNGTKWVNQALSVVDSFNSRVGTVVPVAGDYAAADITNTSGGSIAAVTVQAAIDELDIEKTTDVAVAINHYNKTESDAVSPAAGAKIDKVAGTSGNVVEFTTNNAVVDSGIATNALAPLASPVFTGIPALPKYTLITLPTVVEGGIIFVTDANAGIGTMCYGQMFGSPDVWVDVTTGVAVV